MTVLVTGFGPFPGAPWNPTSDVVRGLGRSPRPSLAGVRVATHVFETSYAAVDRDLPRLLAEHRPQAVVMFGLAARTPFLRIECWARNRRSALLPDVEGEAADTSRIRLGAPPFLRGRAPFEPLAVLARRAGMPARLSHNAGRYLCNYAYWRLLGRDDEGRPAVFIHVPRVSIGPVPARPGRSRAIATNDLLRVAERIVLAMGAAARQSGLRRPASGRPSRPVS